MSLPWTGWGFQLMPCGRIMQTLLPFYAFTPAELGKRNGEAEKTVETFTMIVKKGKVEVQVGISLPCR